MTTKSTVCTPACGHSKNMRRYTICKCKVCKGKNHGVLRVAKMAPFERRLETARVLASIDAERRGIEIRMQAAQEAAKTVARLEREVEQEAKLRRAARG